MYTLKFWPIDPCGTHSDVEWLILYNYSLFATIRKSGLKNMMDTGSESPKNFKIESDSGYFLNFA